MQYAFRPTGSPAAALITLLQHITHFFTVNPYVGLTVISVDFSKAFDTVRHSNPLHKVAQLDIPDEVYNWLVSFFHDHSHSSQYLGVESSVLGITASIIQGSAIDPASFVVGDADLKRVTPGNLLVKYVDNTYIVIPALLTTAVGRPSSITSHSGPGHTISRQIRPSLLKLFSSTTETRKGSPTAATSWHCSCYYHKNPRCHLYEQSFCR